MDLLETISGQMEAHPLPLVAITVAAVTCPDTPVILTLHWHGFVEEKLVDLEDAHVVAHRPVPSSAFQVNARWDDLATLDLAAMEAGWELGAWDVVRAERAGCRRAGASVSESLECMQAFGSYPFGPAGARLVVGEAPDADELLDLAACRGYLTWTFRPVHGGIWAEFADDATLGPDGTRIPPCPLVPIPAAGSGRGKTIYRFGVPASSAIN